MHDICSVCDKKITEKDIVALNKKLLGKKTKSIYCLECLAEYFGCTTQDLLDKIEAFKDDDCELFK